jgi:hypothetical protein
MLHLPQIIVFQYLSGSDLFHKIALTSHQVRFMLRDAGLLNQKRVLSLKNTNDDEQALPPRVSFLYAMRVVTGLEINIRQKSVINIQTLNHLQELFDEHSRTLPLRPVTLSIKSSREFKTEEHIVLVRQLEVLAINQWTTTNIF